MKKKTKIMELKLVRFAKKKGYTIGRLYCLGEGKKKGPAMESQGTGARRGSWRLIKG